MLRADFTMDETYYDQKVTVLHSPIIVFGGEKDSEADAEAISEWRKYTDRYFEYKIFEGGHFYIREHEDEVIQNILECLKKMQNGS